MPSPIGHALAGVAIAWSSEYFPAATPAVTPSRTRVSARLTLVCATLAALPDVDLIVPGTHRTVTHSIGATILVTIIAAGVTGWVTRKRAGTPRSPRLPREIWRTAFICGLAYASHLLLDWLGADPNPPSGIQALWPFSHEWFISPWTVFPGTERRHFFTMAALATNFRALAVEIGLLAPIVGLLGWRRASGSIE